MKKHAKYLVLAVTLGIMALIFFFSSQPGETSYQLSGAVADTVQHSKVSTITPSWFSTQNFNANIRKWAHVYIYCALGVSMAVTVHLWTRRIALWQQGLLAAALCTLYAMSDEIHQYFVPARAMLLTDVGIDAFGFLPCSAEKQNNDCLPLPPPGHTNRGKGAVLCQCGGLRDCAVC